MMVVPGVVRSQVLHSDACEPRALKLKNLRDATRFKTLGLHLFTYFFLDRLAICWLTFGCLFSELVGLFHDTPLEKT